MFGDEKFIDKKSSNYRKFEITWEFMMKAKWTKEEFESAIESYMRNHNDFYFLPAGFLKCLDRMPQVVL